jgi:tetratricopeptide (TPR) repeat protein
VTPLRGIIAALAVAGAALAQSGGSAPKKTSWDLFRERDYARALEEFRKDLNLYPRNAAITDAMGWCELFLGRHDKAEALFKEALKSDADYKWSKQGLDAVAGARRAPLEEAWAAYQAGRYSDARVLYEKIVEGKTSAPPSAHADALAGVGWCLFSLGRHEEALKAFNQAVQKRPNVADWYRGIGYCQYARGRWADALVPLALSLKIEPDDYQARVTAGWCHYFKKTYDDAQREFRKALETAPDGWSALQGLAWCHERTGKPNEAFAAFRRAIAASPDAFDAEARKLAESRADWRRLFVDCGWSALRGRQDARAQAELAAALRILPEDREAQCGLAFVSFRLADYARALEIAEKLVAAREDPPVEFPAPLAGGKTGKVACDLATLRAWCKLRQGRYDEALAGFKETVAAHPDWPDALCGVGWSLYSKGDYAAAERSFQEAARLLPGYSDAEAGIAAVLAWRYADYNAGWAQLEASQEDAAVATFSALLEKTDGRFPCDRKDLLEASLGWALARLATKDDAAAKAAFARALEKNPALGLAHKGLGMLLKDRRHWAEALESLQKARKDPAFAKDADVLVWTGWCHLKMNDPKEAAEAFNEALASNPRSGGAAAGLGWTHLSKNEVIEARIAFERAIWLDPAATDDPDLRREMKARNDLLRLHGAFGWAWFQRAAYAKAEADFREALVSDPNDRENLRGCGLTLLRRGELKEAGELLGRYFARAAPRENPWGPLATALSEWGWTLYRAQKYGEAIDVFNREAALFTGERLQYADPHDGLGWCQLKLDRPEQARAEFLKAIAISPRHESSLKGLETLKERED